MANGSKQPVKPVLVLVFLGFLLPTVGADRPTANLTSSCVFQGSNESILSCPAWFRPGTINGTCECGYSRPKVSCDALTNASKVGKADCLTFDESAGAVFLGACPYNFLNSGTLPKTVSLLNDRMCGDFNRTGLLCSKCKDGLGPAVLSYMRECVECFDARYGWLVYVSATLLPATIFSIVVIVFRIEVTAPSLNIFVLLCQLVSTFVYSNPSEFLNLNKDYDILAKFLLSFYAFWNLDFFPIVLPPFCISTSMSMLHVMALGYIVALYPLFLTVLVYVCIELHDKDYKLLVFLWRPFHRHFVRFRRTWNLKGSVINAFATFLYLAYCKLSLISYSFFHTTQVIDGCGNTILPLYYYDATVTFFDKDHLPFAILALTAMALFTLVPLIVILFLQNRLFYRCLVACRLQNTFLVEVAKVCHKSYKNGDKITQDLRWFAGVYLIFRIVLLYTFQGPNFLTFALCIVITMSVAILRPYKNEFFNVYDTVLLGIFTVAVLYAYTNSYGEGFGTLLPVVIPISCPFIHFVGLIFYKLAVIFKKSHCTQVFVNKVRTLIPFWRKPVDDQNEAPPYRLTHPSEYEPLLPPSNTAVVTHTTYKLVNKESQPLLVNVTE